MVNTITTATASIGAVELVDQIPAGSPKIEILKLVIQLGIAIFAFLKFKKQKNAEQ